MEQELELFKKLVLTDGMKNSSLYEGKRVGLEAEYNRELDIIVEQLKYALKLNEPLPDDGGGDEKVSSRRTSQVFYNQPNRRQFS